ncbi:MAG: thymidine phosphorylase [Euryarchaeota archaeon TMED192]|nr:MAG: thymidine phosphorylase [Euryarchaeota archaeon TMED192]|tara:strand:- start:4394 stop:5674 length:1281 start_codon:yes stop_codon:yes gene_type:complete
MERGEKGIEMFVRSVTDGSMSDEEVVEYLTDIFENGLDSNQTVLLTKEMRDSGAVIHWPEEIGALVVDKHSTGGVGDKVSIALAPALAACGAKVPMISGRGLGHTGGTLDKLESIPGFRTDIPVEELIEQVSKIGFAMVGQTEDLVPADRRMYALRDVSGLVASVPLITGSIVSKKAAEGISALVLDVKTGKAAFMKDLPSAERLARSMKNVAEGMGISTTCLITSMDHPIGHAVGNSLEIVESVETLCGRGPSDLEELVCIQGGLLLNSIGLAVDRGHGSAMILDSLYDGSAFRKFLEMVDAQGGKSSIFDSDQDMFAGLGLMSPELYSTDIFSDYDGWVSDIDAVSIADLCLNLGAGRTELGGSIDHAVGVVIHVGIGSPVSSNEIVATVYHRNRRSDDFYNIKDAFSISKESQNPSSRILGVI